MDTRLHMENTPTGASVAVLPDAASLVEAAAGIVAEEARRVVEERGRFSLALAGGSTPRPVYRLLAAPPFAAEMPWRQTEVFWGDERCVDPTDSRSNERMAREALLDHVPIPAEQIHPMRCTGLGVAGTGGAVRYGEAVAGRAADDYERLLRSRFVEDDVAEGGAVKGGVAAAGVAVAGTQAPGLDLVLLGMGDDGHTASLFPGSAVLDEQERWVASAQEAPATSAATSGTGERLWRVTLTVPFIDRAALVLFVVSGASKAAAVRGALQGEADPHELPALAIRPPAGRLWWLLDRAAASQLRSGGPWGRTIS